MGLKSLIKRIMYDKNNARYESELDCRRMSYREWIAEAEDACADEASAEQFVLLCNPRGQVADCAGAWIAERFERCPEALVIYGDEDVLAEDGGRRDPYFKPDWSPELLEGRFYLGGLVAVRKSWLESCGDELMERFAFQGQRREEAAGNEAVYLRYREECQRLICRAAELAGGYEKGLGRRRILHLPRILFHSRSEECRDEWLQYAEGRAPRSGRTAAYGSGSAFLSIVIPSKDNPDLLKKCIRSIPAAAAGLRYEIIVVDNGSEPDEKLRIERLLKEIRLSGLEGLSRLVYHYEPMPFNFSRMCNLGVKSTSGERLLFLNDDVELAETGCLRRMLELAARPYVGAVGLKLLYPDGGLRQIQHAGITNLPMGPVHKLQFCRDNISYYFDRNRGCHNVLAVTAACLMVEKAKFREAGEFTEELAVAFNDVDLCFRLYELGYENVCDCESFAYHDESYSRGDDESAEKLARLMTEREKLYRRHPGLEGKDPYYSIHLNREGLDTRIRPLYETGRNRVQRIARAEAAELETAGAERFKSYRQDACLMVRVESALESAGETGNLKIIGWSVVLGDNNACYDKTLILKVNSDAGEEKYYILPLQGQYRPDLAENMPDQTNVALCGYMVEFAGGVLPAGSYQLGIAARNRVSGAGLINWSNRTVAVRSA